MDARVVRELGMKSGYKDTTFARQDGAPIELGEHVHVRPGALDPGRADEDGAEGLAARTVAEHLGSELEIGLEGTHLAPVGVAANVDVDHPQQGLAGYAVYRVTSEQDHAGAGAEDRALEIADNLLESVGTGQLAYRRRLPARDDEPVQALELLGLPHLDRAGAESAEYRHVLAEVALQGQGADANARGIGHAIKSRCRPAAAAWFEVARRGTNLLCMRVALVTGANRGIGFEVCRQLGRLGYAVLLGSRDRARGEEAAELLRGEDLDVTALQLDVTSEKDISRLGELERVDALVNNAAIAPDREHSDESAQHVPAETVMSGFETNTLGPYRICQQIVPIMRRQGYGRIVNVSTGMSRLAEMNGRSPAYRMSKTALNALTRILADELRGMNILANSVDPGWVKTRMGGRAAPLTPAEGADTIVWAATLPDGGPTGGFYKNRSQIGW